MSKASYISALAAIVLAGSAVEAQQMRRDLLLMISSAPRSVISALMLR